MAEGGNKTGKQTPRSTNDSAKCRVCKQPKATHKNADGVFAGWCKKNKQESDVARNKMLRGKEQQKQQLKNKLDEHIGSSAEEVLAKLDIPAMDDPVAVKQEKEHFPKSGEVKEEQKIMRIDDTCQPRTFYWKIGELVASPCVTLWHCFIFFFSFFITGITLNGFDVISDYAAVLVTLLGLIMTVCHIFILRYMHKLSSKVSIPIFSVTTNLHKYSVHADDDRADLSKVVNLKHESDVWTCRRTHFIAIPKQRRDPFYSLLFGLSDIPKFYLDSPNWKMIPINVTGGNRIQDSGWFVNLTQCNYRDHDFTASITQVAQLAQTHFFGGMTYEDTVRKLNLMSRNSTGVAYDRFEMFKDRDDTLEFARIFARHVIEDHKLRNDDLPTDFPSAPQH